MEPAKKSKTVNAVPERFHTVTPFLIVDGAEQLIDFLKEAFNAKTTFISKDDDNKVIHATVLIGNSQIMISDTMGMQAQTAMLYLYLENIDEIHTKAVKAGGVSIHEPSNEFYGDRTGAVRDQWGNIWWIATQIEELDATELDKRAKQMMRDRRSKDAVTQ